MAVKSSGIIGITTDVVAEFGGSAPYGLTQYYRGGTYVPDSAVNSNIPTSGQIGLTSFYSAQALINYYTAYASNASSGESFSVTTGVLANGYFRALGYTTNSSSQGNNLVLSVNATSGTTTTEKTFNGFISSSYKPTVLAAAYDSTTDSVYAVGYLLSSPNYYNMLIKLAANGTPTAYVNGSGTYEGHRVVDVHSDGSVYIGGYSSAAGGSTRGFIAKANSSLGYTWQSTITCNTSVAEDISAVGTDSTGNVYFSHGTVWRGSSVVAAISKYNPSGTRQWTYTCNVGTSYVGVGGSYGRSIVFDSSGNGYAVIVGMISDAGAYGVPPASYGYGILKFGPTGTMHAHSYSTSYAANQLEMDGNVLYAAMGSAVAIINTTSLAVNNAVGINYSPKLTGTISTSTSTTLVTGTSTLFDNEVSVGSVLRNTSGTSLGTVNNVVSNTSLYLTSVASATYSGGYFGTEYQATISDIKVSGNNLFITGNRNAGFLQPSYPFIAKIPKTLTTQSKVSANAIINVYSVSITLTSTTISSVTAITPTTSNPSLITYDAGAGDVSITIADETIVL